MNGFDWRLLIALPAAILAAGAVAAAIIRWQATSTVFWVLANYGGRWAEAAKRVPEFEALFRAGELATRLDAENKMLHHMISEKLAPIGKIADQMGHLETAVTLLKDQIGRFAGAIENMPERMAVIEERQRHQTERTGPPDRRVRK